MNRPAFLLSFHDWALFRLAGADAREFLQGVGTQDVAALRDDFARPTLFLTEKGKPLALAWALLDATGTGAMLLVAPGGRDLLLPHLERLRVMEDVEFAGPAGMPRLYAVVGEGRDENAREWAASHAGSEVIAADPMTFLLVPTGGAPPAPMASTEAAKAWLVAQGIPEAGVDFDSDRIATELSMPEAISLTKGCFVGQEIVARTTNRGAVRRRRVGFRYPASAGAIPPRTEFLVDGRAVGFVTSAVVDPSTSRGVGMGYLSTEVEPGNQGITVEVAGARAPIEVAPWPL